MEYQKDWVRPVNIEDNDRVADYYEKMSEYTDEFTGQYFTGKVVDAYVTYVSFTDKKTTRTKCSEVLNLIIQMGNDPVYVTVKIWGRSKTLDAVTNQWGEFGKNPVALQDFLYIAQMQKGDISAHFDVSTPYEDREVYPHICGTKVVVVAVTTEQGTSTKGRLYNKNQFSIFNYDFHSALEIMQKVEDKNDIKLVLNEYKQKYKEYKGITEDATEPPAMPKNVTRNVQKPSEEIMQALSKDAEEKQPVDDFDLPSVDDFDLPF